MKSNLLGFALLLAAVAAPEAAEIKHSFLTMGSKTAIIGEDGSTVWSYKAGSRDGFVLPNGNVLLAFAVKEYGRDGTVINLIKTDLAEIGGRPEENWPFTAIRLANGNTVIGSHAAGTGISMAEVNREKRIVWTSDHALAAAVHHFQILTTNGKPEPGMPLK